jgi:hypothetical protein
LTSEVLRQLRGASSPGVVATTVVGGLLTLGRRRCLQASMCSCRGGMGARRWSASSRSAPPLRHRGTAPSPCSSSWGERCLGLQRHGTEDARSEAARATFRPLSVMDVGGSCRRNRFRSEACSVTNADGSARRAARKRCEHLFFLPRIILEHRLENPLRREQDAATAPSVRCQGSRCSASAA